MMTSSNGNIFRVTGPLCGEFTGPSEFPTQRPVTRSFDVFFDLRLNKRLSKQPWGWWFETPSWSLWRQCNVLLPLWLSFCNGFQSEAGLSQIQLIRIVIGHSHSRLFVWITQDKIKATNRQFKNTNPLVCVIKTSWSFVLWSTIYPIEAYIHKYMPEAHFTNDFSIVIRIPWKICFSVNSIIVDYITCTCMQNFIVITSLQLGLNQN